MRRSTTSDFVFQAASLLVAFAVVHAAYVLAVRPRAQAVLAEQYRQMQANPEYVQEQSVWVILKDYEQEAEFVLFLWALAILAHKWRSADLERWLLGSALVPVGGAARILPEDAREYARQLQALPDAQRARLLPRALLAALQRFRVTRSIQDASATARETCAAESDRLDSELAMIRYIAWAIPSVGFLGTVRGIGQALSQAHRAVQGDITGVTESLGVAFNSTFVALLLSLVLMFVLHQVQLVQERLVLDAESYVDEHLLQHLQA